MKLTIPDELFNNEELKNTPGRYKRFIESWLGNKNVKFTTFPNPYYNQIVGMVNIDIDSLCSHHILPFTGKIHIGYIPDRKICGASKLIRVAEKFANRPQIQEKLTQEIADYLDEKLKPLGVMVIMECSHECIKIRGVKNRSAVMVTSALKGVFKNPPEGKDPRQEFFELIKMVGAK